MYRRIIVAISFAVISLIASAQLKETTVIFEQTEWNFGEIEETDGKVSHTFRYTNSGNTPLLFYSVNASCGCTTPTYMKEPLMPGKSADFIITYDPANRPGRFEKYVVIQGNMEGGNIVIKIKGVVNPRPRGVEDDYPILLSNGIRLSDSQMSAGAIPNTRNTRMSVKFFNTSDKTVEVGFASTIPSWMHVDAKKSIEPGKDVTLGIDIVPNTSMWGHLSAMIKIELNGQIQPIEMFVSADLTEDFSMLTPEDRSKAPYIIVSSYFYSFSDCQTGETLKREFKITNKGKSPLQIRYIDYNKDKLKVGITNDQINVGETATLTVEVLSSKPQEIAEVVRIISNDPIYPVREIRIIANIL